MRVYAGALAGAALDRARRHDLGRLVSPWGWKAPVDDVPWCFDNGAYRAWERGVPWDSERFARYALYDDDLSMSRMQVQCYAKRSPDFAVCPDVVAGGKESLEFSVTWRCRLPSEFRWYLAVQNGMREGDVDAALAFCEEESSVFWGLFVGGDTRWKFRTAPAWVRFAHDRGLNCHVGRVSSERRLTWCELIGADSVDSSVFERFVDSERVSRARAAAASQSRLAVS